MLPIERRINNKKQLKEWIEYEMSIYGHDNAIFYFFQVREIDILKKHNILLRKTEYYTNKKNKLISTFYRLRLMKMQNKYSLHIPINVAEKGLRIMHVGPILVNSKAIIGRDVCLHINTGLVAGGTNDEAPELCDGVVVGVGAILLGGVHVAENVAIGANSVVNKDVVEPNIAVAGVPAKKISNNGRLEWNRNRLK